MTFTIRPTPPVANTDTMAHYAQALHRLEAALFNHSFPATPPSYSLAASPNAYGRIAVAVTELDTAVPARAWLQIDRALERLTSFLALPPDWDSYGALPVQALPVRLAKELLQTPFFFQLLPTPNTRLVAFPGRDGGVQLDIDGGRYAIEVTIAADGETEYAFFRPDNELVQAFASLQEAAAWYTALAR